MKIINFIGILAIICGVSSCDKEEQRSLENYWISLATITQVNNDGHFFARFDNGTSAMTIGNNVNDFSASNGQRIMINYSLSSDSTSTQQRTILVNSISTVEIKNIKDLTTANQDSIGNDPVDVEKIWIGGNYINVSLSFYGNATQHQFNLVRNEINVAPNDGALHLELRQNSYGDASLVRNKSIISFDLSGLTNNSVTNTQIIIEAKNYAGNVTNYTLKD